MTNDKPQTPQRATRRKLTSDMNKLNKCAGEGLTRLQTAKRCNMPYQKVCRLARDWHIVFRDEVKGRKPTKGERVKFVLLPFMNDALASVDYKGVAKAIGCSPQYVYKIMKELVSGSPLEGRQTDEK
jgi:hypothetical protein